MKRYWQWLYYNQPVLYKGFLFLILSTCILYLFPKGGKFQYEFQKGFLKHPTLFAPFDFSILKTEEEIAAEKALIVSQTDTYYRMDPEVALAAEKQFDSQFASFFQDHTSDADQVLRAVGKNILQKIYEQGIFTAQLGRVHGSDRQACFGKC